MKKIKYALMLCLAAFALVVTGCGNPEDPTSNIVEVEKIEITSTVTSVTVGEKITLTAKVSPDDATESKVTWSSSAEDLATVDEDGVVTGLKAGKVTITAKAGEETVTVEITVNAKKTESESNPDSDSSTDDGSTSDGTGSGGSETGDSSSSGGDSETEDTESKDAGSGDGTDTGDGGSTSGDAGDASDSGSGSSETGDASESGESKGDESGGDTESKDSESGDSETDQEEDADDDEEANMPDLFTMTAEACDQGIRVTVSYTELAGGEYVIADNSIFENNSKLNIDYPETLNTNGTATILFPFTESGKEYSFGIRGNYHGTAYDGWFAKTLVTCTATTTTAEATWYENNKDYFTGYNVDCNFDGSKITLTRDFPTVKDMDESSALAKIKEMKDSVLNFAGSITKVEKKFNQFVYGYVNYDPKADWKGFGLQELTSDDIALTETAELADWCYSSYKYSPSTFINNGYDGRYAGSYAYSFTVGSDVWTTFETWSDQEYYYLLDTTNTVSATTKETTRVLHAVYDTVEKYFVKTEEHKTVASGTSLNDLALTDKNWTATALVEGEDYVAVLYKADLTKITSVSDIGKDSLYLRMKCSSSDDEIYYDYLYLENGKLYSQTYEEKTGFILIGTSYYMKNYWEKVGDLTEYSFNDGKISTEGEYPYTMYKLGDTYFMYDDSTKLSRISGSGLYSTFGLSEGDSSLKITFKEDGNVDFESSYKNSDGTTGVSSWTVSYTINNGFINFPGGGGTYIGCGYDGSSIYLGRGPYEEVSGLPTVTETTE